MADQILQLCFELLSSLWFSSAFPDEPTAVDALQDQLLKMAFTCLKWFPEESEQSKDN